MSMQSPLGVLANVLDTFNQMAINIAMTLTKTSVQLVKSVDNAIPSPSAVLPTFGQGPRLPSPATLFKPLEIVTKGAGGGFGTSVAEESRDSDGAVMF